MSIKTPLGRVRGLGSAKEGVGHFWAQRVSAVALVPLTVWFLASVVAYAGADYETAWIYLSHPVSATLMLLFLGAGFYHMRLGLKVVVEDYIHQEGSKIALLVLIDLVSGALCVLGLLSVLKIAIGSI